jgi:hypothetical protein
MTGAPQLTLDGNPVVVQGSEIPPRSRVDLSQVDERALARELRRRKECRVCGYDSSSGWYHDNGTPYPICADCKCIPLGIDPHVRGKLASELVTEHYERERSRSESSPLLA